MSEVRNGDQKEHKYFRHYVVSINSMTFYICTLNSKNLKGRTKSYYVVFRTQRLSDTVL